MTDSSISSTKVTRIAAADRPGREPAVVVTDRSRHILRYYSLEGKYLSTVEGFLMLCHFELYSDTKLVPDLIRVLI